MLKQLNKTMIKLLVPFVIAVVIFLIIMFFSNKKTLSFSRVEKELKKAAVSYYEANPINLPTNNGDMVIISGSELENGYMKPLSSMVSEKYTCNSLVRVYKNFDEYVYIPYLNCGENYVTKAISDVILSNVVATGPGLYQNGKEYIYRGSEVNNYIKFSDRLWRIVSVDENRNVKIIEEKNQWSTPWDNHFNINTAKNDGINTFEDPKTEHSVIRLELENIISDKSYIKEDLKYTLIKQNLCVGERALDSVDNSGNVECTKKSSDIYAGLINVSEYMQVSLDANCKKITDNSCANYNYMSYLNGNWWTSTPVAGTSNEAFYISYLPVNKRTSSTARIRTTLVLNGYTNYEGGTGTSSDPYTIVPLAK